MQPIRVLIADDHALFREGLQALLLAVLDVECVGEAATGEEAVAHAKVLQPDVVLMDINMPDLNGVEATRRLLKCNPDVGVIMVTMLEDDSAVFSALRAGARGYVLKGAHHEELLQAIRAVAEGQALFGPAVAGRIIAFFQSLERDRNRTETTEPFAELTAREHEVLELVAQGLSNSEIAENLSIGSKTVRNHITSIFRKLQVNHRAQAIVRAREAGFG